jgi:hypothetical protein
LIFRPRVAPTTTIDAVKNPAMMGLTFEMRDDVAEEYHKSTGKYLTGFLDNALVLSTSFAINWLDKLFNSIMSF